MSPQVPPREEGSATTSALIFNIQTHPAEDHRDRSSTLPIFLFVLFTQLNVGFFAIFMHHGYTYSSVFFHAFCFPFPNEISFRSSNIPEHVADELCMCVREK